MDTLNLKILMGSVREGRFNEKATAWIKSLAEKRPEFAIEVLDPKDWPFPFYKEPLSPSQYKDGAYPSELARKWAAKIAEADAFIVVTPEYNHGTSAVLKNMFDQVFAEWNNKAIGFVSYGSAGGSRAVEHLRLVSGELLLADVRASVLLWRPSTLQDENGILKPEAMAPYETAANIMFDQLVAWGRALKGTRLKK